ncbi:glycosyltransferase [candidate division KSB1 bacterium]|nr:glycosyltransferase [candidate division KSB1 bacterium]
MNFERKLNILHLVNGFAIGGGELKLLELAENLDKKNYNQVVCSVGQGGPLQERFEKACSKVFVFPKKHRFDITLVFKVARLIKNENIDIVQTTLFYADIIGVIAGKFTKVPVVISWDVVTQPFKPIHKFAFKHVKKYIDMIVTVSDAIKKKAIEERKMDANKVQTIHYGVDTNKFIREKSKTRAIKKELNVKENELLIGVVARMTVQKGHKYLVEAVGRIKDEIPGTKFILVGDGPLRKDIEDQISELQLTSFFKLLGFRNDVEDLLTVFDIFVLPSLWEGLPNVVLEAMACSNPVIATAVDGTPEAVQDGETGLLVPSKQPEPLADAILKLVKDKKLRAQMSKNGRKRVEEEFSLAGQIEKFEKLYHSYF